MKHIVLSIIRIYKFSISPLLGNRCRFHPSCSEYAHNAIQKHGLLKGILLGMKRLLKCHPLHPGGADFVP